MSKLRDAGCALGDRVGEDWEESAHLSEWGGNELLPTVAMENKVGQYCQGF